MKSFFKYMVDSAVIYVADKYGFGTEEDVLKKEIQTLQYQNMLEKAKNLDGALEEITVLKNEVKQLTSEKMSMLERQVERLQFENQQYRLGTNQQLAMEQPLLSLDEVARFAYKESHIKYILNSGVSRIAKMEESDLLKHLQNACSDVFFNIIGEKLVVTCAASLQYNVKEFSLHEFISMEELRKLDKQSGIAKRTIY